MNLPVYNPHLLSKRDAIAQFIARKKTLDRVLENLPAELPSHLLFIGTRGMGKTTLLQRIRYAVEDDAQLHSRYIALQFPEEQYAVSDLLTFYLNCIDALSDALEREGKTEIAQYLDRELPQASHSAKAAMELLEGAAKLLGRRLLLLLDNAERILDQLEDKQQWSLRETLSSSPYFVFYGASTQAVISQFTSGKAFYEFFQIEWMNPLKPTEIEEILVELSKQAGEAEGKRVQRWIEEDRGRLQTLIRLTGGNPRTMVILLGLVLEGPADDFAGELERLLDACTPGYKGRMDDLPQQAQAVLHGVAEHFDPVSAAEIAAKVRVETTAVSTQLTRLIRMGLVEKTDAEESRARYQVVERFFNIWYLMRQARRVRARMRWLVEFLRVFYTREELVERGKERAEKLRGSDGSQLSRDFGYALAYSEAVEGRGRASLELSALRCLMDGSAAGRKQIQQIINLTDAGDPLRSRAERLQALDEAHELVFATNVEQEGWSAKEFWEELAGSWVLSAQEKKSVAASLEGLTSGQLVEVRKNLTRVFNGWGSVMQLNIFPDLLRFLLSERLVTLLDGSPEALEEARDALSDLPPQILRDLSERYGSTEIDLSIAYAWAELANDKDRALRMVEQVMQIVPPSALVCHVKGNLLREQKRTQEAERAYRQAIEIDPKYTVAWYNLGVLLSEQKRTEEAERAFRQAIEIDPKYTHAWNNLGVLLREQKRTEEAERAYRQAIEIDPKYTHAWNNLGLLLKGEASLECFVQCIILNPDDAEAWAFISKKIGSVEKAASGALAEHPGHPVAGTYLAAVLAAKQGWKSAEKQVVEFLPKLGADQLKTAWWALETLSKAAIKEKSALDLVGILENCGLGEAWRPWIVALRTAHSRRLADLKLVAPEVREPAEAILKLISQELFE